MNRDPYNCPFCQTELGTDYTTWGMDPELWEYYRYIHFIYHLEICPYCKQKLDKSKLEQNKY